MSKTRDRQAAENQQAQENLELCHKIEQLQTELWNSHNLLQEVKRLQADKSKEAEDRALEVARDEKSFDDSKSWRIEWSSATACLVGYSVAFEFVIHFKEMIQGHLILKSF